MAAIQFPNKGDIPLALNLEIDNRKEREILMRYTRASPDKWKEMSSVLDITGDGTYFASGYHIFAEGEKMYITLIREMNAFISGVLIDRLMKENWYEYSDVLGSATKIDNVIKSNFQITTELYPNIMSICSLIDLLVLGKISVSQKINGVDIYHSWTNINRKKMRKVDEDFPVSYVLCYSFPAMNLAEKRIALENTAPKLLDIFSCFSQADKKRFSNQLQEYSKEKKKGKTRKYSKGNK